MSDCPGQYYIVADCYYSFVMRDARRAMCDSETSACNLKRPLRGQVESESCTAVTMSVRFYSYSLVDGRSTFNTHHIGQGIDVVTGDDRTSPKKTSSPRGAHTLMRRSGLPTQSGLP